MPAVETLAARGVADLPPAELAVEVLAAWDDFLAVVTAPSTDLTRPSRLPGWSGKDTCVHLGSWPDSQVLDGVLASAREGGAGAPPHPDETNEALVAAHRDATPDDVVEALHLARERVAAFFASPEAVELGRSPSRSTVGPLPVLTLIHAGTYELAVHALDLAPCGAPRPPSRLLHRGLGALIDVTGALAARSGVELALTGATPETGWRFTSGGHGWTTEQVPGGPFAGTGVRGEAVDLLEASAGRAHLPALLVRRRLHVQEMHHWMRLAPLVEDLPGLPGGPALAHAVHGLRGVGSGVGKVLSRFRR